MKYDPTWNNSFNLVNSPADLFVVSLIWYIVDPYWRKALVKSLMNSFGNVSVKTWAFA